MTPPPDPLLPGAGQQQREAALEQLRELQCYSDIEIAHTNADYVLCELLKALGYADVIAEWEKVEKWYA